MGTGPGLARLRLSSALRAEGDRRLPVAAAWHCIGRSGIQSHHNPEPRLSSIVRKRPMTLKIQS